MLQIDNQGNGVEEMTLKQPKTNVVVELIGEDGNIFNLAGKVSKALKRNGYTEYAKELQHELFQQKSYGDALNLLSDYVEVKQVNISNVIKISQYKLYRSDTLSKSNKTNIDDFIRYRELCKKNFMSRYSNITIREK